MSYFVDISKINDFNREFDFFKKFNRPSIHLNYIKDKIIFSDNEILNNKNLIDWKFLSKNRVLSDEFISKFAVSSTNSVVFISSPPPSEPSNLK